MTHPGGLLPRVEAPTQSAPATASTADRASLAIWLASRVSVFIAAIYTSWVFAGPGTVFIGTGEQTAPSRSIVEIWNRWDADWYQSIALQGYGAAGHENNFAFLPAFPALLRLLHAGGLSVTLAGLLISVVAGGFAAVALGRLTASAGGRPEWGVLAWVLAPVAVFLAAPYTEALFCAFAFWAWVYARRGSWVAASALVAVAALVRVNALFLAVALVVAFLTSSKRSWRQSPALLLPGLATLAWVAYYHSVTGSWQTWFDAEAAGWDRHLTSPVEAFRATYENGWTNGVAASFALQYRFEIAAMAVLVVLGCVLLVKRWWGEATYVLLTCISLATSTLYYSVPRSALVLFPVWMLLGTWMSRSRTVAWGYVAVAAPLMLIGVAGFVDGHWIA